MSEKIGTPGALRPGGWRVDRASHIKVDPVRVQKFDVFRRKRWRYRMLLIAMNMLVIAVGLWCASYSFTIGVCIAVIGYAGALIIFLLGDRRKYGDFTDGFLASAVVISTEPVKILVLTPIGFTGKLVWGTCIIALSEKGDWKYAVGDRVPCSVWFEELDIGYRMYRMFHPQPLIWATDDCEQLNACINAIDEEEWSLLEEVLQQVDQIDENIPYELQIRRENSRPIRLMKLSDESVFKAIRY